MSSATTAQPTTALAVQQSTSPLITELSTRWKINAATMLSTLKATVFPQTDRDRKPVVVTNEQMIAFLQVAHEYNLNPFTKEIYAFPTKNGGIVPMVPVDGWSNIVNRNPHYDGIEFKDEWVTLDAAKPHNKSLFSTTCTIHRKDRTHPTIITEYMQECFQENKDPWVKWPARMLRHKAFIQCARIAFSLGGIYDPDEAERIADSGEDKPKLIERPRVLEGSVNLDTHSTQAATQTEVAQAATKTCVCTCCKAGKCTCADKSEFDRCGCAPCAAAAKTGATGAGATSGDANPEVEGAAATSASNQPETAVDTGNSSPAQDDIFGEGKAAQTEFRTDVKKLMAIAKSAYGAKDYETKIHEVLKAKFGIDSLRKIPKEKYDEICEYVGKAINTK